MRMPEEQSWDAATFEGNRRLQQEAFRKLTFREKVLALEEMSEVVENLLSRRARLSNGCAKQDVSGEAASANCESKRQT
jgi:hypothetical protein